MDVDRRTTEMDSGDRGVDRAAQPALRLEVVVIPVSDVDRAKAFYAGLGWRLDADFSFENGFRGVQFTPPGSGCSIQFGDRKTSAAPGSAQGLYLVVSDIEAAHSTPGPRRRGPGVIRVDHGVGGCASASGGRAPRARGAHRAGRCQLA